MHKDRVTSTGNDLIVVSVDTRIYHKTTMWPTTLFNYIFTPSIRVITEILSIVSFFSDLRKTQRKFTAFFCVGKEEDKKSPFSRSIYIRNTSVLFSLAFRITLYSSLNILTFSLYSQHKLTDFRLEIFFLGFFTLISKRATFLNLFWVVWWGWDFMN